jgi:hypothetical protein
MDLNNPYNQGAVFLAYDPYWRDYPTHIIEVEVVGLYSGMQADNTAIYIPNSLLPGDLGRFSGMSFVLTGSEHEQTFLAEYSDSLNDIGMRVTFLSTGADTFWASVLPLRQSAIINVAIFAILLILALTLAVFTYMRGRRRDFAILRALGTPKPVVVRGCIFALFIIGFLSIAAGGTVSWNYALEQAQETLTSVQVPEGILSSSSLPIWMLGLMCVSVMLIMLVITAIGAVITAKHPVLVLLQRPAPKTRKKHKYKKTKIKTNEKSVSEPLVISEISFLGLGESLKGTGKSFNELKSFVFRHILRSGFKSILTIGIAAIFVVALGWMNWTIERNTVEIEHIYNTTSVQAEFIDSNMNRQTREMLYVSEDAIYLGNFTQNVISEYMVRAIQRSGFVMDYYLEKEQEWRTFSAIAVPHEWRGHVPPDIPSHLAMFIPTAEGIRTWSSTRNFTDVHLIDLTMIGINNAERYFSAFGENIIIEYADGIDESLFQQWHNVRIIPRGQQSLPFPAVLPRAMMEKLGLELGDEVAIIEVVFEEIGILVPFSTDGRVNAESIAIIAGIYWDSENPEGTGNSVDDPVLISLGVMQSRDQRLHHLGGYPFFRDYPHSDFFSRAVFDLCPSANRELNNLRVEMNNYIARQVNVRTAIRFNIYDDELRQVVDPLERSLQLMSVLYPITIAVSVLVAVGLTILTSFQNAKSAAVMRVLGSKKSQTRAVLCAEQMILSVFGLIVGLITLSAVKLEISALVDFSALMCAGLYVLGAFVGSLTGAVLITNKTPLELLQVRE